MLRHSPAWPDQWGLDEAYANPGTGYADWVKFGLPDCNGIIVDSRCPSLTAIVARDNVIGTQFHPEKSQTLGLRLLANFLKWAP